MAYNRDIEFLHEPHYLVVRFGADGAILYTRSEKSINMRLFFDPQMGEEGCANTYAGKMSGIGNAFTAGLAAALLGKDGGGRRGRSGAPGRSEHEKTVAGRVRR